MKWAEIKIKSQPELEYALRIFKADLVDLRFKAKSGTLKQVRRIRLARKNISQILSILDKISKSQQ